MALKNKTRVVLMINSVLNPSKKKDDVIKVVDVLFKNLFRTKAQMLHISHTSKRVWDNKQIYSIYQMTKVSNTLLW